jgi:2-polyprenyl-6-methoxyphenol hydroxylase-like FAD-dependent oxidoreductase
LKRVKTNLNREKVKTVNNEITGWTICKDCQGRGKKSQRIRKKIRLGYEKAFDNFNKTKGEEIAPIPPKRHQYSCLNCNGSGLIAANKHPVPDTKNYPPIAIMGGGIGGVALAVACLHRGIPFTLYERDSSFNKRSQGYGLTLQQASKAIQGFGILSLKEGLISTRHLVHTTEGKVIGEWGMRKWKPTEKKTNSKRTNVHIARQSLRLALLEQLGGDNAVKWNHQLVDFKINEEDGVDLSFQVDGKIKNTTADLAVGADGIRSTVRKLLIGDDITPLRYLDCIVILGICPLDALKGIESSLLDSATVFQTANGHERIYMMPYASNSIMWQLSFPMPEKEAKALRLQGPQALKEEACRRAQWHHPIPQILTATLATQVSGYPVYDRELLSSELLENEKQVTLIGDAAHPMSPFKGQGANQALLDALSLAREIFIGCNPESKWREAGLQKTVLTAFETEMLARSASKVKDSAAAAQFLHSEIVLHESNGPRGRHLKKPLK